jgi:hypothetical protein
MLDGKNHFVSDEVNECTTILIVVNYLKIIIEIMSQNFTHERSLTCCNSSCFS